MKNALDCFFAVRNKLALQAMIYLGLKPSIQHAFAAHNLEDVAFYDADRTRCNECDK